jgi:hypothetical protein
VLAEVTIPDTLGLVGALLVCAAYFLVSQRRVEPEGAPYQGLNLAGAVLLLVSLWYRPNPGAILIEVIWAAIALAALARLLLRRG